MDIGSRFQGAQQVQGESAVERTQAALPVAQNPDLTSAGVGAAPAAAGDETHLSSTAGLAASLVRQALSLPDVRGGRVGEIRQQVDAGSYQISSSAVAQKVIGSMLEK